MRRDEPSGGVTLLLAFLLVVPPAGTVLYRELGHRLVETGGEASATDEIGALRQECFRLESELDHARRRIEKLERWRVEQPSTVARVVRVLPISDPSPQRHALWVACRANRRLPADAVLVSERALVGCVARGPAGGGRPTPVTAQPGPDEAFALGGVSLARVQTVLDSEFRIRARTGSVAGFVKGTGDADASGRPFLIFDLLDSDAPIKRGDRIYTDGGDGSYPSGLLIGEIAEQLRHGDDPAYLVLAAVAPEGLREGVLLSDRVLEAARAVIEKERS